MITGLGEGTGGYSARRFARAGYRIAMLARTGERLKKFEKELELSEAQIKRWGGKRYLVLISVVDVKPIMPFEIDKSNYGNMDDWLPVEDINKVKM